jgi:uncharacterized membrane protein YdbT with pleckstrin-like domain
MSDAGEPTASERTPAQRRHLRRILWAFLIVVVLLPAVGLGGAWSWLLVPLLLVAVFAAREAYLLRRTLR